ncbi:uncharacterized protein N7496_010431 [Penicillium cataractarum]|uniref:Uncharacterized protein n=1 Tax=Penicillium cataractarum TaxID=2100454 RepID=A0A9W9V0V5_9EURO|nr:uncharacterized protein N7496_010431 [Penicillium cataractarum]KAJ5364718.1 hypothetical protein N7496_010431 [Penicillium cataractarum]
MSVIISHLNSSSTISPSRGKAQSLHAVDDNAPRPARRTGTGKDAHNALVRVDHRERVAPDVCSLPVNACVLQNALHSANRGCKVTVIVEEMHRGRIRHAVVCHDEAHSVNKFNTSPANSDALNHVITDHLAEENFKELIHRAPVTVVAGNSRIVGLGKVEAV